MQGQLRVLIVEHHEADCCIAKTLLRDYDREFSWKTVASPLELSQVSADFEPHIVLCTDGLSTTSSHSVLDSLRLLSSQTPTILVSSVREVERSIEGPSDHSAANIAAPHDALDIANLRRCFSSLLESSSDPAVMSNAAGWITHANVSACRRLDQSRERSLGTLLGGQEGHRLAFFGSWTHPPTLVHAHDLIGRVTEADGDATTLALVALNLHSARIPEKHVSPADGADMQPEAKQYGSILRIAPDDFLMVLPPLSSAEDAAFVVQGVLESIGQTPSAARPPHRNRPAASTRQSTLQGPDRRLVQSGVEARPAATALSQLEANLGDAMQRHALTIEYQPQFELHTGRGCGVEALVRWTLSTGQIIAPSVFIPLAERVGIIHALGAWVLKSACETAYAWCSRDAQRTTLSVNVSAHQINENFCAVIERTLKELHFPAKQLELEITESALVGNTELTIECLKRWKLLGVQIAVDDFGAGYSSLSYLSRLPVDRLKLDQSLIHRMTLDAKSKTVMRSAILLGADLGVDVMAEGVETEEQLQMLDDLGCPRVQGYLLARPMPPRQAQIALRKAWGNRPSPNPVFRPSRMTVGESRVQ
jgi:EAL domain-containing protein (putative c-di-GMP-specific phosphodiesterase class I)/PAS domain-containing protein